MKRALPAQLLVAVLATPLAARAYRPFNSTDAAVAEKGQVEVELGPVGVLREGSEHWLVAPALIANWGFAERFELVLEGKQFVRIGAADSEPRVRIDENALSLKGVLREGRLQEKSGVSIATEISALLPAINGESGAGAEATLIASHRWETVTVHLNGAIAWTRAHNAGWFTGLIVEGHDAWTVRPVAEVFAEGEETLPVTVSGLAGLIWRLKEDLSLDAAVRYARAAGVDTAELRAGLTWAFAIGFPSSGRKP
ncbi:MAG TPA: hypothetical protein VG496_03095 [Myxococcales bacterium]|nr:hypothetical protein [Myxococcales bacterium]